MKKKVLLVDNDQMLLKVIGRKLEGIGHEVVTAEDGLSALNVIISFVPDIMFIDLIMPNIDGKKLCQIIRKMPHMQDCYLVILSAAVAELAFDFTTIGADACIAKGSFAITAEYILSEIGKLDAPREDKGSDNILGLENVYARQMTKELLSQNRHLEMFLESTTQGILELFSGKIVYANSAAASLCGLPEEMLLTLYPPDLFDDAVRSQVESLIKTKNDEPVEIGNKSSITLNNRQVIITKLPVNEDAATIILLITDVTDRKRMEHELRQSQKMEAVGTLAGGIAHDFNNILSAIFGYTELALLDVPECTDMNCQLNEVLKASGRAKELVSQILAFSHHSREELKPMEIQLTIKEVLKLLRASLPATIEIRQHFDSDGKLAEADSTQIHQLIMNLCTNAAAAMDADGGVIEVSFTSVDIKEPVTTQFLDLAPGSYLKLTVSDTGNGMTPEVLEKIFDPYFTTKEKGKGTGLGLAVVHGILKRHRAAITVEATPAKGSTFHVYFPRIKQAAMPAETGAAEPLPGGHECVLIVDDEEDLVNVETQLLSHLGYEVVSQTSSIEVLELFQAQPDRFDVVITDMTMPKMTGDKLAKEILKIRPDLPIILCTGYSEHLSEEQAKKIGIKEYCLKPVRMRDLARTMRKVLDQNQC